MDRVILWLSKRKAFTLIAAAVYYAAVVRFHEEVSIVSVWLQTMLSLKLYNKLISILGILAVAGLLILIIRSIMRRDRKGLKIFYLFFTLLLVGISYNTLLVVNVESIHYIQYALLALPVFALTMNFGESVLIVTLLGAIDEANQHFILHNWKYLDFNDIILNLVGAAIGAVLIFILLNAKALPAQHSRRTLIKSPFLIITFVSLTVYAFWYYSGILRFYPGAEASKALIVLSNIPKSTKFWISFEWGKTYHILTPLEGLFLAAALITCYAFMDYRPEKAQFKEENTEYGATA